MAVQLKILRLSIFLAMLVTFQKLMQRIFMENHLQKKLEFRLMASMLLASFLQLMTVSKHQPRLSSAKISLDISKTNLSLLKSKTKLMLAISMMLSKFQN